MRSNLDILDRAWDALKGKWLLAIGLSLLHGVITAVLGNVGFGLGSLALSGALAFGFNRTMVQIYRGQTPAIETYFDGFRNYLPTLILTLLVGVIVVVGLVLLIVPGILAAIGLSQAFYVLQDRPDLGAEGALRESWRLTWTNGRMWKVLLMGFLLMFVMLGGMLALGVGVFFAIPLISVAGAGLYEELKDGVAFSAEDVQFV
ncbi:MAG: hypothetical protein ACPG66_02105 [Flavobacteriales bacterium]